MPPVQVTPRTPRKVGLEFPGSEGQHAGEEMQSAVSALTAAAAAAAAGAAAGAGLRAPACEIRLIDFGLACQLFSQDELIQADPTPEPPDL